jgi:hypothetical protein
VNEVPHTVVRPPLLTIVLISGAALAYEVLLMRLLSILQWHHFAYMIISLALLGYGVSGTFLCFAQQRLVKSFAHSFIVNIVLFGVSTVACFQAAQQISFNAEEVLWDPPKLLRLFAIYLLLALPFFFVANALALSLIRFRDQVSRVYAFDLIGAGLGSLSIVVLTFVLHPLPALMVLGILVMVSVAVAAWELSIAARIKVTAGALLGALVLAVVVDHVDLTISPYKGLSQTLRIAGTKVVATRSSPLGYLSVLESEQVPLRHAPGLSITASVEPPPQVAIFTDADNMTVITEDAGERSAFAYLDDMTSALPYHLNSPGHALILGSGGGADIQQARYHGVPRISAVELNPQLVDIVRDRYRDFSNDILGQDGVELHLSEARGFVSRSRDRYGLIQLALLDSFAASSAGLYALNESYLYTVEALRVYLRHLEPGGYLAITRWIKLPPRDTLKLFATAIEALQRENEAHPDRRLLLIRSWQTSTLLIKNGLIGDEEITALKTFAADRAFDVAWYPGIKEAEVNRYNVLRQPYYYGAAMALLGPKRSAFLHNYKYDIRPTFDDRPYFFHFFKWRVFSEIMALRGRGGMPLLEIGYLVLVATLFKAVIASVVLIVLPLTYLRRQNTSISQDRVSTPRVLWYFFAIGLGFLFVEIGFIQQFILLLHHPVYAVSVTLTSFLVFAGAGSAVTQRTVQGGGHRRVARYAIIGIALFAMGYTWLLGPLFEHLIALPMAFKVIVSVLLIAPLAFCMGMPFPLGLSRLSTAASHLVPWAWGVNGCASVISAVLATLCAIHFGFAVVITLAVLLYISAAVSFPRVLQTTGPQKSR